MKTVVDIHDGLGYFLLLLVLASIDSAANAGSFSFGTLLSIGSLVGSWILLVHQSVLDNFLFNELDV